MKLTEDNFINTHDWDSSWWVRDDDICIAGDNNPIKQQILENQEIVERLKEKILLYQGDLNLVPIPNVNNELLDNIIKYLILELQSILKGKGVLD